MTILTTASVTAWDHPPEGGVRAHRWSVDEYYGVARAGVLDADTHLELIDGEVIEHMSPIGAPHVTAVTLASEALRTAFGEGFVLRVQSPLRLSSFSEPEPDLLIVTGRVRDYAQRHPNPPDVRLLIEVSETTLAFDRGRKAALYASAGISDYWIINLIDNQLEIYRSPAGEMGYQQVAILVGEEEVAPLASPAATILVTDLLP
ncbi:hypothetical protein CCAX7_29720 [Capsulimonas corticalis]|uniref:Uncharacterized protein n=1 Tax=Capsulimonas corticalis TaxID=2219043 RepID=A0A402CSX4_9BACT|nr:Uma2 family endonuclease [Capsulimonas corticalis]BDI30921.1 hypothetical protein CCAX7_29720 [Capsulimonas corticalis]